MVNGSLFSHFVIPVNSGALPWLFNSAVSEVFSGVSPRREEIEFCPLVPEVLSI
jgi:hypothetical protein